jgi:hypothetical protein
MNPLKRRGFELRPEQGSELRGRSNYDMTASKVTQAAIQVNAQLRGIVVGTPRGKVLVYMMAKVRSDCSLLAGRAVGGSRRIAHLKRDDPQQDNNQKAQHAANCLRQGERNATHYSHRDPEGKHALRRCECASG